MEKTNKEIIENLAYELIFDPWDDDKEEALRANLLAQTLNPACKLPLENKVESIMDAVGEASNVRSEIENGGDNSEWAADHLEKLHNAILTDLNKSFVL